MATSGRDFPQWFPGRFECPNWAHDWLLSLSPPLRLEDPVLIRHAVTFGIDLGVGPRSGQRAAMDLPVSAPRLAYLDDVFANAATTLMSHEENIANSVLRSDLLIGAVLIPGAKAPHLVTAEMVKKMKPGSVIVDVAVDQGGCVETAEVTSHDNPILIKHGVLHYAVPNIPGSVSNTSTYALTNVTLKYARDIARWGLEEAVRRDDALAKGVNVYRGSVTYAAVAQSVGEKVEDLSRLLNSKRTHGPD